MRTAIMAAVAGITLSACATGYQPDGFSGGFSEVPLSADTYRISVAGNGYTSPVRVREMSLLRAAELTEQAGYNYFIILDFVDDLRVSSYTTAGSSTTSTTGSATAMGSTVFGSATSQTTYQPPTTQTVTKPLTDIVVRFVPDEHAAEASALSVQQVYGMYAGKYGLN